MRHIPVLICSLGLLSAAFGCSCLHHEAGICDCQNDPRGCNRYGPGTQGATIGIPSTGLTPVPLAAPVPEAPKPLPIIPK